MGKAANIGIKGSVDDGHVDREKEDDRFAEEKNPGPGQGDLEGCTKGGRTVSGFVFRKVDFAGCSVELGGSFAEKDWLVCFWDGQGPNDPDSSCKDGHETFNPSPALRFSQKPPPRSVLELGP
jgi:hypothetical protein